MPLWIALAIKWPIYTDFLFYSTILKSFSSQLWSGDLYPRWLLNTNAGLGSPVFVFYPPLAYYIMSLFEWLSPIDPHGFGRLTLGLTLALFAGGITSYRWFKNHMSNEQAQNGALLYISFPYQIFVCYHGFSLAQLWAFALIPVLLKLAGDFTRKGIEIYPKFACAYAALTFAHPLSAMAFGGIPCLYILCFSPLKKRVRYFITASSAALIGIGTAAVFLLPAMDNKSFVTFQNFVHRFDYSGLLFDKSSLIPECGIVLTLIGLFFELPKPMRSLNSHTRFWLGILAGMIFLTTPPAKPLWDHIVLLQYLQGAWRLVPLMIPATIFVVASWLPYVKSRWIYPGISLITLGVVALYCWDAYFYITPRPLADIMSNNLISEPEYTTKWLDDEHLNFQMHIPDTYRLMSALTFTQGQGNASLTSEAANDIRLHAEVLSLHANIALKRLYFPGWIANDPAIMVSEDHALLALDLPKGSYDIVLTLPWLEGEKLGAIISYISLFALGIITVAIRGTSRLCVEKHPV